jgi:hypothetical protein
VRNTLFVRGRALLLVLSTAVVALVLIGLVAGVGASRRARSGVLVTKVGTLGNGNVMPIMAPVPGTRHQQVQVFVVRLAGGRPFAAHGGIASR